MWFTGCWCIGLGTGLIVGAIRNEKINREAQAVMVGTGILTIIVGVVTIYSVVYPGWWQ